MKRFFYITILALTCLFLMSACENSGETDKKVGKGDDSDSTEEQTDVNDVDPSQTVDSELSGIRLLTEKEYNELWPGKEKIVWIVSDGAVAGVDPEIYIAFNNMLLEKGADVVVDFVGVDTMDVEGYQELLKEWKRSETPIDILTTGFGTEEISTNLEAIKHNLLEPLDTYLQSEEGQKLYHQFDKNSWDRTKINNSIIGISNFPILAFPLYLYMNIDVAEQFNISIPDNITDLAELEESLKQIMETEQMKEEILPFYVWGNDIRPLTGYSYLGVGIAVGYLDGKPHAFNPFEDEEVISLIKTLSHYFQEGYWQQSESAIEKRNSGDFYASLEPGSPNQLNELVVDEKKIEVVAYKVKDRFIDFLPNGLEGIASWSEHKGDAFKVLTLVNTDKDLSNLLRFGIEGKHYTIENNVMKTNDDYGRVPGYYSPANDLITYSVGQEPENKEEVYREWNAQAELSPIAGFTLNPENIASELKEVEAIYSKYEAIWSGKSEDVEGQLSDANQELKDAGITIVLEEINRQLTEWYEAKE